MCHPNCSALGILINTIESAERLAKKKDILDRIKVRCDENIKEARAITYVMMSPTRMK